MKKSKFADKITDLVEDTLVAMGQSDPFTVYDNLDDEFSFTLEHDITHRNINVDLTELYRTKQEEDIKVKDLYKDHIKSRVTEFVEHSLELMRTERYSHNDEPLPWSEEEDEEAEYEEDEDEEYDEDDDYEDEYEEDNDLEDDDYDDEEDLEDGEDDEEEQENGLAFGEYIPPSADTEQTKEDIGAKISLARDVLPDFLQGDRFDNCVFVEYPKDKTGRLYQMDKAVFNAIKDKLGDQEPYIAILDDYHLMCVAGENPEYLQQMLKDMKESGINIKDAELYHFENENLAHVFAPDGRQVYSIDDAEEDFMFL